MNYTNNRNNRCRVSQSSSKANIKQSKVFDNEIKTDNITAAAAASARKNIPTRDRSCIQTILDYLDGYYNDDEQLQVNHQPSSPPIQQIKPSSLRLNSHSKIPKEIIKKESPSPPPTVPSTPKHSNNKTKKKGLPRRRHSLPDNAKLPDNVKLNQLANATSKTPQKQATDPPAQPIKQTRRRRHTLSGNTERPDISCIQSLIRQSNIHEEDYYHHLPKNKLAVVNNHEFERVETDRTPFTNNNIDNQKKKSQVKRIIERRRRHSMPDNMKAPNPSDLLMSLPLPATANHHGNGLDKQSIVAKREKRLDQTTPSTPNPNNNKNEDRDKNKNENEKKYKYKVGQSLQDATSHSLRFSSKSQATKLLSQLNTPLFVKRTSNQQWQAQWSYCLLVKHIYNENKLISVEVSLTDSHEGKDKKRVRTKVIEEKYFERWLMLVNLKTVLVKQDSTTSATTLDATDNVDDDQTDMATRGNESIQENEDRPPRMIFRGNKEDVNSSIYSSSCSSSSSEARSSSNEFYSVISSTESFSSSSIYSSSSSDTSSSYDGVHDIPGKYLNFNSPVSLPNDDDVSTTSAISPCCSSGASDRVLIASKSARLLRASF